MNPRPIVHQVLPSAAADWIACRSSPPGVGFLPIDPPAEPPRCRWCPRLIAAVTALAVLLLAAAVGTELLLNSI